MLAARQLVRRGGNEHGQITQGSCDYHHSRIAGRRVLALHTVTPMGKLNKGERMNSTLLRALLKVGGSLLVGFGIADDETVAKLTDEVAILAGSTLAIIGLVMGWYNERKNKAK